MRRVCIGFREFVTRRLAGTSTFSVRVTTPVFVCMYERVREDFFVSV